MCDILKKKDFKSIYDWSLYIGNVGEKAFVAECAKKNYKCLPASSTERFDFLVFINKKWSKVQVKAISKSPSDIKDGCNTFYIPFANSNTAKRKRKMYTSEEIDYFAYYLVEYDTFYLIPVDVMHLRSRVLSHKTKQLRAFDGDKVKVKHHNNTKTNKRKTLNIAKYKNW